MIAADTPRTRAYLTAMERANYLPSWVLILSASSANFMPGKLDSSSIDMSNKVDKDWPEASFDLFTPLEPWLNRLGLNFIISNSCDINDDKVIELIAGAPCNTLVYSGYGGVLLCKKLLDTGKNFLHAHGGYLPAFRGSTTNYYSILTNNTVGASAILLTSEIDCGPVICRYSYVPPKNKIYFDYVYDSAIRARVLLKALEVWCKMGKWEFDSIDNTCGYTYYVIHPILKHLAICKK